MPSILIADDEVVLCMQLADQLISWGHEVEMAHSGEEAVRLAIRTKPDLLLMDIVMPGSMNGLDAAKIILSQIDSSVVFVTGCEDHIWVDKAGQCFPAGYLYKPISLPQLYAMVYIALRNKQYITSPLHQKTSPPPNDTINQKEMGNRDYERSLLINVQNLVCPFLLRELSAESGKIPRSEDVHILNSYMKEIILPLIRKLSDAGIRLSPAEVQVAVLVRLGKGTKQIANLLHLSDETINSHRKNIRKKLGITSSITSLGTYLSAL